MAGLDPAIRYVCGEGWIMPAQASLRSLRKLGCEREHDVHETRLSNGGPHGANVGPA